MPSAKWNSLTRVMNWEEQLITSKLFQKLSLERVTKQEFIQLFPTILKCSIRVARIERVDERHFTVSLKNYARQHKRDLSFLLAQMGDQKSNKK